MTHNKDKGTTDKLSNSNWVRKDVIENYEKQAVNLMNTICKEHEWVEVDWSRESVKDIRKYCSKCGTNDFRLNEQSKIGEWQLCPKCNGQGLVSKPPYVAGDVYQWASTEITFLCDLCNGAKAIIKPTINFCIEENIKLIEDNNWDDIMDEFCKTDIYKNTLAPNIMSAYYQWLRKNYNAPIKKPE